MIWAVVEKKSYFCSLTVIYDMMPDHVHINGDYHDSKSPQIGDEGLRVPVMSHGWGLYGTPCSVQPR